MKELHDHYFRKAKEEGYLARSAYKLLEIQDRRTIIRPGDFILDCGCAPGSWLQVASRLAGPRGFTLGVDLKPVTLPRPPADSSPVRTLIADLTTITPGELASHFPLDRPAGPPPRARPLFDVILSDMAPNTTGDHFVNHHRSVRLCDSVLALCPTMLKPGGRLVMKVFEGESYMDLVRRTQAMFASAKGLHPKASRSESTEIYIIAEGYRGPAPATSSTKQAALDPIEPPSRAASTSPAPGDGWSTSPRTPPHKR